jgi:hypothetical protein
MRHWSSPPTFQLEAPPVTPGGGRLEERVAPTLPVSGVKHDLEPVGPDAKTGGLDTEPGREPVQLSPDDSKALDFDERSEGLLPFGQVPVVEIDGAVYAQSNALLRYIGRRAGLYPDGVDQLRCDIVLEAIADIDRGECHGMRTHDAATLPPLSRARRLCGLQSPPVRVQS